MSSVVFVNVAAWVPDQVADWLKGLDDVVANYVPQFQERGINGKKLLCLSYSDLEKCHITKLGHQELIMEAVDLLTQLHHELDSQNLQSLALQLSCRANYLHNEVKVMHNNRKMFINGNVSEASNSRLPSTILCCISDTVSCAVALVFWLDRSPFEGSYEYTKTRNELVTQCIALVKAVSPREDRLQGQKTIMKTCALITTICNRIVRDSCDPLVLQPASLEIATIRKKPEEELGLRINSTYSGTHITLIKDGSPSDACGKVEEGDEIVQVNYQTVVGWSHEKLVQALKENQKEVTLTLKKRPRHTNPLGGHGHRNKKKTKNVQQSTFPKALSRRSRESEKGARAPLKDFLSAFPPSPSESLSESCHEINIDSSGLVVHDVNDDADEEEVFQGHTDTLDYSLDPKQRRATVSGGSPTLTRPSIIVDDFELSPVRPKSHTISSPSSEDTYSTGTSTSEGQASPELDMRQRTEGRESTDSETLKLSPSTERRIELKLKEYRTPLTATKSCDSPGRRRRSGEVASDQAKGSPSLVRIRRLDSKARADIEQREREKNSPENTRPQSVVGSYTVNIIGGVVQRLPSTPGSGSPKDPQDPGSQSPTSILRHSRINIMRKMGTHRRISCKDLGHGDCQGWLWKKKDSGGVLAHKWSKRWFIMKRQNLYYYKTPEDSRAEGVLYLPGFKISPAPEIKSKKFAFKAHHSGTTFFFAAERQDDMGKWMNKLGLAAITYDASGVRTTAGFYRPDSPPHQVLLNNAGYYSESDEDNNTSESSTPSSPATPRATTPVRGLTPRSTGSPSVSPLRGSPAPPDVTEGDHLARVYTSIRRADLTLDGASVRKKRTSTMAPADRLHVRNSKDLMVTRKLSSLQRTLRAKEKELEALEAILKNPSSLQSIKSSHPDILEHLYGEHLASSTQSEGEYSC